jgi:hypothetical protein
MKFKIGDEIKVEEAPSNCYELELVFHFKDRDEREDLIYFPAEDEEGLARAVDLLMKYFEIDYNSRCANDLSTLIDMTDLEQELDSVKEREPYHDFLYTVIDEWPVNECGIPYMLSEWRIRFYDSSSRIYKVEVINEN